MKKQLQATLITLFALSSILPLKSTFAQTFGPFPPSTPSNSNTLNRTNNPTKTDNLTTSFTRTTKNVYQCINYQGKPTTIVDTPRGRIKLIVWESNYFSNSGWTPERRCQAVTARFQKFSDNRTLKYVSTGIVKNKYKVICVSHPAPGRGYDCNGDGLLITLEANDNPNQVLKNLFVNAAKVGGTAVLRGQTAVSIETILNRAQVISPSPKTMTEPEPKTSSVNEIDTIEEKKDIFPESICSPPLCN